MYANVSKFLIWIPHENIGDPYLFFLSELSPILEFIPFNKVTLKSRIFVLLLLSWASSVGEAALESGSVGGKVF